MQPPPKQKGPPRTQWGARVWGCPQLQCWHPRKYINQLHRPRRWRHQTGDLPGLHITGKRRRKPTIPGGAVSSDAPPHAVSVPTRHGSRPPAHDRHGARDPRPVPGALASSALLPTLTDPLLLPERSWAPARGLGSLTQIGRAISWMHEALKNSCLSELPETCPNFFCSSLGKQQRRPSLGDLHVSLNLLRKAGGWVGGRFGFRVVLLFMHWEKLLGHGSKPFLNTSQGASQPPTWHATSSFCAPSRDFYVEIDDTSSYLETSTKVAP